jgi:hypothetical protein
MKVAMNRALSLGERRVISQSVHDDLRELGIGGEQMIPAREVLVHGLGGGGPDGVRVLPNLMRDVEQRDHDGKHTNDLSEIGQVV